LAPAISGEEGGDIPVALLLEGKQRGHRGL